MSDNSVVIPAKASKRKGSVVQVNANVNVPEMSVREGEDRPKKKVKGEGEAAERFFLSTD